MAKKSKPIISIQMIQNGYNFHYDGEVWFYEKASDCFQKARAIFEKYLNKEEVTNENA